MLPKLLRSDVSPANADVASSNSVDHDIDLPTAAVGSEGSGDSTWTVMLPGVSFFWVHIYIRFACPGKGGGSREALEAKGSSLPSPLAAPGPADEE